MRLPSGRRCLASCSAVLLLLAGSTAAAQLPREGWSVKGALGPVGFADGGGSATALALSTALGSTWRVEPEATYLYASPRESGILLGVSFVRHYRAPSARLRPYLLTGLGLVIGAENWSEDVLVTPSLGCGAQISLGGRVFVAPEVRLGRTPLLRFTLGLGYSP